MAARDILVIDDEIELAETIKSYLEQTDYDVRIAHTGEDGIRQYQDQRPEVVLLDLRLPDASGQDVFQTLKEHDPHVRCVFMTGDGGVEEAVRAMKAGAVDYLAKPVMLSEISLLLKRMGDQDKIEKSLKHKRNKSSNGANLSAIIGDSRPITRLREQVSSLLEASRHMLDGAPPAILITGETGTGKQMVARAVHFDGRRSKGPFIELNCAALPDHLVESELFGHERGAFTDAKERKIGLIEAADGGTLFLDEVGELALATQAKLLKVLESQTLRRLGSLRDIKVNLQIVAATNRSLETMVEEGTFRADLYYRIKMIEFTMPTLGERGADVLLLAEYFLAMHARRYKKDDIAFTEDARDAMVQYGWPGNVRELNNVVERSLMLCTNGHIDAERLSLPARKTASASPVSDVSTLADTGLSLDELECRLVEQALDQSDWNVSEASRVLGLSRDTLRYRIEKFDLARPATDHNSESRRSA